LEALKQQLALNKQQNQKSNPSRNIHSEVTKHCHVDENNLQIESEISQHLVDKLDFNFVKMCLLNHTFDHVHQLGNRLNICSELTENAIMDYKQMYAQSNLHEAAFQMLQTEA
jgi:hypothetical protein